MNKGACLRLLFVNRPVAGQLIDSVLAKKSSRHGDWGGSNLDALQQLWRLKSWLEKSVFKK